MSDNKSDIWRLQAQFDIQGLVDALKQEDSGIRKRAAAALRAIGATDAVPSLRVALINERDSDVRSILASALDTLSDTNEDVLTDDVEEPEDLAHVNHLIQMLDSDVPDQVIDAAQQLGEFGDQIAVEPLVLIFNNVKSSIHVKLAVAEALLKLDGAPVEVALLAALRHNDWHIRRNGAAILGQLQAEWAIEPLSQALRDSHSTVRRTARAALQRIGTNEAINAMQRRHSTQPLSSSDRPIKRRTGMIGAETIPSAPRDGLLNRLKAQQQANHDGSIPQAGDTAKHLKPTKPLDPSVVEEIERRMKRQQEQSNPDEDDPDNDN